LGTFFKRAKDWEAVVKDESEVMAQSLKRMRHAETWPS